MTEPTDLPTDTLVLINGLRAVQDLIDSSSGVSGLHLNGEIAPWSDLQHGGPFSQWLEAFDEALEVADLMLPLSSDAKGGSDE